MTINLLTTETY